MQTLHRFFFALQPPARERRLIGLHRGGIEAAHGWVTNDRLHMTIGITGDFATYPSAVEHRVKTIGGMVEAAPIAIALDRLTGSRHSVALRQQRPSRLLRDLHGALEAPLTRAGLSRPDWHFSPHVTLAYRTGEPFQRQIATIAWDSRDFVLIYSAVGEARHVELGRWPLLPRQGELFH